MIMQIHEIINQFTREAQDFDPTGFATALNVLMQEISSGFFYLMYIDYERNNYKEYFDQPSAVYSNYSLDLLSPKALAAYNKDRETYPELFI